MTQTNQLPLPEEVKASDLIRALEKIVAHHGDLPVVLRVDVKNRWQVRVEVIDLDSSNRTVVLHAGAHR